MLRAVLVGFLCLLAYLIPNFGALVGLIGSLGGSTLQFIVPPLCYVKLLWHEISASTFALLAVYIIVGIVGGFVGFVQSLEDLI